jgi:deazaflavin-dependent oxidoreductase (nitroreductase family)
LVGIRERAIDLGFKALNRAHNFALWASRGRLQNKSFGMPTIELHTTGRKSGRPRQVLLTAPLHDGERVVLVASKGGDDRNPEWYLNLVANPDVEIVLDGVSRAMRARTASAAERADLWPQIVDVYRGYESYQKRANREIPVVICEPRAAA